MKKKIAVLLILILGVALSMGCVEETTTVNIEDEDDIWSNQSQKEVSVVKTTEKSFWFGEKEKIVIIGRLIEITFNCQNPDVLVFQNGKKKAVFCASYAEKFGWIVGENHKVTIKESGIDSKLYIIDAETTNDT